MLIEINKTSYKYLSKGCFRYFTYTSYIDTYISLINYIRLYHEILENAKSKISGKMLKMFEGRRTVKEMWKMEIPRNIEILRDEEI